MAKKEPQITVTTVFEGGLQAKDFFADLITQLSHKQMTAGLNHCGENQEEKRSVDNQAGTQFAESKLPKSG